MVPENMGIICFDRKYGSKIWWFPKSRFWPIPIWQSHGCWFVSSTLTTGYHSNIPGSKPWHAAAHIISKAGMYMFKILRCLINMQCIILYVYIHYIYTHTLYIYILFIYTLYIHYIYIIYTLYIHYIYIIYTLYIHYIYIIYTLYIQYIYIIYTLYIHYIYIIYTLYINYVYIIYTLYIHYIYIIYTLYIDYIYIIYIHYIYYTYIYMSRDPHTPPPARWFPPPCGRGGGGFLSSNIDSIWYAICTVSTVDVIYTI